MTDRDQLGSVRTPRQRLLDLTDEGMQAAILKMTEAEILEVLAEHEREAIRKEDWTP